MTGKTHKLSIYPTSFIAIANGTKPFEITRNDQGFAIGDIIIFKEIDSSGNNRPRQSMKFTGRTLTRKITYVSPEGKFGLRLRYCAIALSKN